MAKILLAEDDLVLSNMIATLLRSEGHLVEQFANGREAVENLLAFEFDIAVVDWEMPERTGIQIISAYREVGGEAKVLMLTAKGRIDDKTIGFQIGADDYLTKPFHMVELSLRITALLKRNSAQKSNIRRMGDLELDVDAKTASIGPKAMNLTSQEFRLLELFLRYPNQVFSIERLMSRVGRSDCEASTEAVRMCITRLRKRLKDDKLLCPTIVNLYGEGYALRMASDERSNSER